MDRKRPNDISISAILALGLIFGQAGVASATVWRNGDLQTFSQYEWGDVPTSSPLANAASLLQASFGETYLLPFGVLTIGVVAGPGNGFAIYFGSAHAISDFLPSEGPPTALDRDLADPPTIQAGRFAGVITALRLNVDFYDADILSYGSGLRFGDLILHDLPAFPSLNGLTVRQFEHLDEIVLGGDALPYPIADLSALTEQIDLAFGLGFATPFANDHLAAPVPESSSSMSLGIGVLGLSIAAQKRASQPKRAHFRQ